MIGTGFLLLIIVGSGIMGTNLSTGQESLILLVNSLATCAGLFVLISLFGPVSGAHFNPLVTGIAFFQGKIGFHIGLLYVMAQTVGAFGGVFLAHFIYNQPLFQLSNKIREGSGLYLSEFIATFGLVLTILGLDKFNKSTLAAGVSLYIGSAYWFTSSTSFSNPIVTLSRSVTDSFTGIHPHSVGAYVLMQLLGAIAAFWVAKILFVQANIRDV